MLSSDAWNGTGRVRVTRAPRAGSAPTLRTTAETLLQPPVGRMLRGASTVTVTSADFSGLAVAGVPTAPTVTATIPRTASERAGQAMDGRGKGSSSAHN
ncbi:hypothetical protein [Plantactinospora veratri]